MLENFHPLFLLEFLLFNGVVLAWAAWELWSIRKKKDDPSAGQPAGQTRHAEGQHGPDDGRS